jgi:hypothetical protein
VLRSFERKTKTMKKKEGRLFFNFLVVVVVVVLVLLRGYLRLNLLGKL